MLTKTIWDDIIWQSFTIYSGSNMLVTLDSYLLSKFEKFSHWWQRTFGQDCFWCARQITTITVIVIFISGIFMLGVDLMSILLSILIASISLLWFIFINLIECEVKKSSKNMLANPEKKPERAKERLFFLLSLLFFEIIFIKISCLFLGYTLYVAINYFCACDPLPPGKSRVRQRLESIVDVIQGTFLPKSQPVPVPTPSSLRGFCLAGLQELP